MVVGNNQKIGCVGTNTRHEQLNRRLLDLMLLLVVIFVFVVNISVMCIHSEAISSRVNKDSLLPAVDGGMSCVCLFLNSYSDLWLLGNLLSADFDSDSSHKP